MKNILYPFLIICSLLISEKSFAEWNNQCCTVGFDNYITDSATNPQCITFHFKFFEYEVQAGMDNSYLESFEAYYSSNAGRSYTHLMSASTENQHSMTWAWISLDYKKKDENLFIISIPPIGNNLKPISKNWNNDSKPRIGVRNMLSAPYNESWIWIDWYFKKFVSKITHIRIRAKWHTPGVLKSKEVSMVYVMTSGHARLNSYNFNFSNLSTKKEMRIQAKKNTVKAYKKENSIFVQGALSKNINVYTNSGKLVKTIVADNDIVKFNLSVKQVYIINIGQISYKIAL